MDAEENGAAKAVFMQVLLDYVNEILFTIFFIVDMPLPMQPKKRPMDRETITKELGVNRITLFVYPESKLAF